jgi:S1-C subfamily serine protease
MIRKSIIRTMESTFIVQIPHPAGNAMLTPKGTGFFISGDGYFITAKHVVESVRNFTDIRLSRPGDDVRAMVQYPALVKMWDNFDIALLKIDFNLNKDKEFLKGKSEFSYIEIEFDEQIEGTPVYSYGFPLSRVERNGVIAFEFISPRVTSAIIASQHDLIGPIRSSSDPKFYAIDKALNNGNGGGPIVLTETGKVISVCIRPQPVSIRQDQKVSVTVPLLYGITSSLKNIEDYL